MSTDYVRVDTTPVLTSAGKKTGAWLLWGDRVQVEGTSGSLSKIRSGRHFETAYVKSSDLGGESLLEVYFIDVGQGDGVLIRTPDHRHVLLDGGLPRSRQMTGKNAADFVDWKFTRDYRRQAIELDAVIATHNDLDHFGGLLDLLSQTPQALRELKAKKVTVEHFYHAGLSWWKRGNGRWLGPSEFTDVGKMWTQLLGDRDDVSAALGGSGQKQLSGEWAKLFQAVFATRKKNGQPTPIHRLSHMADYLPGFAPAAGQVAIRVLAPVEFSIGSKPALRYFSEGDSKNTNGQSVLLRLDYGRARILMTGDLNTASQAALLLDYAGSVQEFACDVGKACHHGSDDIDYRFLQAMQAAVTVISSGDNEGFDHPRPSIIGASATSGYFSQKNGVLQTPLVYSTEIARSHKFEHAAQLDLAQPGGTVTAKGKALEKAVLTFRRKASQKKALSRKVSDAYVLTDLVYGLVNVRTDGSKVLCATRNESDLSWEIKSIASRF